MHTHTRNVGWLHKAVEDGAHSFFAGKIGAVGVFDRICEALHGNVAIEIVATRPVSKEVGEIVFVEQFGPAVSVEPCQTPAAGFTPAHSIGGACWPEPKDVVTP